MALARSLNAWSALSSAMQRLVSPVDLARRGCPFDIFVHYVSSARHERLESERGGVRNDLEVLLAASTVVPQRDDAVAGVCWPAWLEPEQRELRRDD